MACANNGVDLSASNQLNQYVANHQIDYSEKYYRARPGDVKHTALYGERWFFIRHRVRFNRPNYGANITKFFDNAARLDVEKQASSLEFSDAIESIYGELQHEQPEFVMVLVNFSAEGKKVIFKIKAEHEQSHFTTPCPRNNYQTYSYMGGKPKQTTRILAMLPEQESTSEKPSCTPPIQATQQFEDPQYVPYVQDRYEAKTAYDFQKYNRHL